MSRIRTALVGVVAAGLMLMSAGAASAAPSSVTEFDNIALGDSWWLESSTEITTDVTTTTSTESQTIPGSYKAQVQQPINPDGTSTWPAKRGVIPVQFKLTKSDTVQRKTASYAFWSGWPMAVGSRSRRSSGRSRAIRRTAPVHGGGTESTMPVAAPTPMTGYTRPSHPGSHAEPFHELNQQRRRQQPRQPRLHEARRQARRGGR